RLATRAQNQQNRSSSTSHKGVTLAPDGKWLARCASNGKRHHIGRFESMDEALLAYRQVARQLHGSFFKE
ncbi:MAG: hypothetical protein KA020_13790, partial [Planctomycetes bacterium]|nr:hypothetical protein [Planctomycetota bacterium]